MNIEELTDDELIEHIESSHYHHICSDIHATGTSDLWRYQEMLTEAEERGLDWMGAISRANDEYEEHAPLHE